jgi:hypothetical protein
MWGWNGQDSREYICGLAMDRIAGCPVCVFDMDRKQTRTSMRQIACGQASRWERKSMKKDKQETMSEVGREEEGHRNT